MRKVIETRETIEIGKCIYCGTTEGKLTDEHITPFGLSGRLELLDASCRRCADITRDIENTVLGSMRAARAELKTKTRTKRSRKMSQPMLVEKNGRRFTIQVPLKDQWKVIRLPIFPLPAAIDNHPYDDGIESTSFDQFELSEKAEDIAKKHGVDRVVFREYPSVIFARFIAKMAYGYAVGEYSLDAFEEIYVAPAILGTRNDIGRWVGCPDRREFPQRDSVIVSVGFKVISGRDILVRLKMFAQFDGAEYVVVVGRLKEVYAVSFEERIWHLPN
jgi:hypothetical protein